MMSRFKEEERNEKAIRNLLKLPENRRCINCNSLGPQYVCTNFWTFVCTTCSGIHREFTHRVKSVSMAKFTSQEVSALQGGGNASAKEIYFKEWDPQRQSFPDSSNVERLRDFIKHVYVDRRYSGERSVDNPPRVKTGEAEGSYQGGSRSPPFRDERNSEDGKLSNGGFKVEGKSPDHQRDPDISSPPIIRPIRDILGEKASPIQIEPPKSNGPRPSDGSLRTQRTVSSSSLGSSNGITTELKTESSLIDFDAVPEPSSTAQVPQVQQAAPFVTQQTSSNNNWANFDTFQEVKPTQTPSTTNLLDVLSELSVPAFNATLPAGSSAGNTQLPVSTPTSYSTVAHGPNSFVQGQNVHPQAFAQSFNQAVGGSQNQQWNPSLSGNNNTQVLSSSQGAQTQVIHGVDVKPTVKKELPADLFSSNFSSFAAPGPGWFPAPQYGMGFNMQYNVPMPMPPVYQQPSKPSNPFDVNESSPVQATTFPSMVPLQGALPNVVPQSSIHRTLSLGTLSPSWIPTQSSNPLPSTSTIQRTSSLGAPPSPWMPTQSSHPLSYGPAMPSGPFMGQVAPNMPPSYRYPFRHAITGERWDLTKAFLVIAGHTQQVVLDPSIQVNNKVVQVEEIHLVESGQICNTLCRLSL